MVKLLSVFAILFVVILLPANSFAQQWTSEQKDVWAGEIKIWDVLQSGNSDAFMSYMDDSYVDWDYRSTVPENKSNTSK